MAWSQLGLMLCLATVLGCLEHSPLDPGTCRTGELEASDGFLRSDRALRIANNDDDELLRCTMAQAVEVQGEFREPLTVTRNFERVGALTVGPTQGLDALDGFRSLQVIEGDFVLADNENLAALELTALRRVDGALVVEGNSNLGVCETERLLAQLERPPSIVALNGVPPCRDPQLQTGGNAISVITIAGAAEVVQVEVQANRRLLYALVRKEAARDVSVSVNGRAARSVTVDAPAVLLAISEDGAVPWAIGLEGEWPRVDSIDRRPRFRVAAREDDGLVYLGWIEERATVGPHTVTPQGRTDQRGMYIGTISADGQVTLPTALSDRFEDRGPVPKWPVAMSVAGPTIAFTLTGRAALDEAFWGVASWSAAGTSNCAEAVGCVLSTDRAFAGPVQVFGLQPRGPNLFVLAARRVGSDPVELVGWSATPPAGAYGFVGTAGVGARPIVFDATSALGPTCVAGERTQVMFIGAQADDVFVRTDDPNGGSPIEHVFTAGAGAATRLLPTARDPNAVGCAIESDGLLMAGLVGTGAPSVRLTRFRSGDRARMFVRTTSFGRLPASTSTAVIRGATYVFGVAVDATPQFPLLNQDARRSRDR